MWYSALYGVVNGGLFALYLWIAAAKDVPDWALWMIFFIVTNSSINYWSMKYGK